MARRWQTATTVVTSIGLVLTVLAACTTTVDGTGSPASTVDTGTAPRFSATTDPTATAPASTRASAAPTTSRPLSTSSAAATPTVKQIEAALQRLAPGQRGYLVGVPAAIEAATLDQSGHITFWRYTSRWAKAGASTYPFDHTVTTPSATVTGARLTGMTHATFIAHGSFSGDGSGNAVAYTTGAKGWGAIKAEAGGNIGPSGQGVSFGAIGLAQDFAFSHGLLMSADCSAVGPIADCGGNHRVLKYWRWAGHDFVLDHRAGLSH